MARHSKSYVLFPDVPNARGFGPFTGHKITYSRITGTRKRDIDGAVWYAGIIGPTPVHRCRSCGSILKERMDEYRMPVLICESGQKCKAI